ncbi:cytochrome ubiquinol oxidase subunit I [Conexibacter sp. W3-3-2]|nr:cytochrome ubiquinol oxidase subunit I [Conexibacter sp. W3-3-2]
MSAAPGRDRPPDLAPPGARTPEITMPDVTSLDLARWQFGLTTLMHFAVVGVSIGLVCAVLGMQLQWLRTGDERWLRLTKFYGRAMLIAFAVGVVTGIVQTFQFGMNWAGFSRYVGDVFGAPLALEGLAAFFVESLFLGFWIFGWGRLNPKVHAACLGVVAAAAMLSAYAILVANSWMQAPTGYRIVDGRAELTDLWSVLVNVDTILTTSHVLLSALVTGAVVVLGIAVWHIARGRDADVFALVTRPAAILGLLLALGSAGAGHFQAVVAMERQPLKMAAAEALYSTEKGAGLSIFAIGGLSTDPGPPVIDIRIPYLLSFLEKFDPLAEVKGIDQAQAEAEARYGPGDYTPVVGLMYWSFRAMVGSGMLLIGLFAWATLLSRRRKLTTTPLFLRLAPLAIAIPVVAQAGGWILREGGRQPWAVQGLLRTEDALSTVSATTVGISLVAFLTIYGVVFACAATVLRRELGHGLPPAAADDHDGPDTPRTAPTQALALSY